MTIAPTTVIDPGFRLFLQQVVAVTNGKGGVGKTSITVNAAANLATLHQLAGTGARVLVVDLDHQGDLGDDLGYNRLGLGDNGRLLAMALQGYADLKAEMAEALHALTAHQADPDADQSFLAHARQGTGFICDVRPGLDVITGGKELLSVSGAFVARQLQGEDVRLALAALLVSLAPYYDMIFIDTPPSDQLWQTLALAAARWVIVPSQLDSSSIKNIAKVAELLLGVRDMNPGVEVAGIVLFDVPTNAKQVRSNAEEDIGRLTAGTSIPIFGKAVRQSKATARESRDYGLLPFEMRGSSQASDLADEYLAITMEFLRAINHPMPVLSPATAGAGEEGPA